MSDTPTSRPQDVSGQFDRLVERYNDAATAEERARILDEASRVLPAEYVFNFKNAAKRIDEENPIVVPEEPAQRSQPNAGGSGGSGTLDLGDAGAVKDFFSNVADAVVGGGGGIAGDVGSLFNKAIDVIRNAGGYDPATGQTFTPSPGADPEKIAQEEAAAAAASAAGSTGMGADRERAVLRAADALRFEGTVPFDPIGTSVRLYNRRWLNEIGLTDPATQNEVIDYFVGMNNNVSDLINQYRNDQQMNDSDIAAALVVQARGGNPSALGMTVKPRQVLLGDQLVMSQTGGLVNEFGELSLDANGQPYVYDSQNPVVFLYELADTEYANWIGQLFDWGLVQTGDDVEVRDATRRLLEEANAFGLTLEAMSNKYWNPRYGTEDGKPRLGGPIQVTAADQIRQTAMDEAVASLGRALTDAELKQIVQTVHSMETNDAYARQAVSRASAMGQTTTYEPMGSLEQVTNSWVQNNLSFESQRAREMSAALYLSNLGR